MYRKVISIPLLIILYLGCTVAFAADSFKEYVARIKQVKLENGLTVILYEDRSIKRVVLQLFVGVGSRNEYPGITGISHLIEHLYMPGKRPGDLPGDDLDHIGGSTGAHTYADFTDVIVTVPRDKVEPAIRMMANRFRDLGATRERVEAEKRVVMNERLLKENGPIINMLIEQLWPTAFLAHPYKNPVGGWPSDIQSTSVSEVNKYFKTYYVPNNAVLVVVGNVKSEDALVYIKKYWGTIPSQPLPEIAITAEPEQRGARRALYHYPTSRPAIAVGYKVPALVDPDRFALDAIRVILADGATSRLNKALRARELILSVEMGPSWDAARREPILMTFVVNFSPSANIEEIEEAESITYREIERLGNEPVTEYELQKAKNKLETQFYSYIIHQPWTLYAPGGKAVQIGYYQMLAGNYRFMEGVIEQYQRLTANSLLDAARKYLNPRNRTTVVLLPDKEKK
jgi:zinc protease